MSLLSLRSPKLIRSLQSACFRVAGLEVHIDFQIASLHMVCETFLSETPYSAYRAGPSLARACCPGLPERVGPWRARCADEGSGQLVTWHRSARGKRFGSSAGTRKA